MTAAHYKPTAGSGPACRPGSPVPTSVSLWPAADAPQDVTCANCRRSPLWQAAAGTVNPREHGTMRGYRQHRSRCEPQCEACDAARRADWDEKQRKRTAHVTAVPRPPRLWLDSPEGRAAITAARGETVSRAIATERPPQAAAAGSRSPGRPARPGEGRARPAGQVSANE